ncbi:MAG: ABC transporter substrate-binding protein [Acidimicrobiales bacterium]
MIRPTARRLSALAAVGTLLLGVAACGDDTKTSGSSGGDTSTQNALVRKKAELMPLMAKKVGKGEGAISILAWPGYAESGKNDPNVDWVSDFEASTGCKADIKEFPTSDEAINLIDQGGWDVVSASGDATLRLIAAGKVVPVNTALVPNYQDVFPYLKNQPWNSVDGQMFGIPHGWGANLLQYRTDIVTTPPDSWGAVFDPKSPYKGKITAYDSPIYIADAALYLMSTKPELNIKDPYALDDKQFAAAVALLKEQKPLIGEYWSDYLKQEEAFTNGSLVLGTSWQVIANTLEAADPPVPVKTVEPKEGSTGWSDTWMVTKDAKHPNCAYKWLDWIISPDANAQVAEWFGEAPANAKACEVTTNPDHCTTFHATDEAYAKSIHYWNTPTSDCLDGRTDVKCKTYNDWAQAWDEIRG